jgi:hypothetical protein
VSTASGRRNLRVHAFDRLATPRFEVGHVPVTHRQIDPRGHRFGAALSVLILVGAFIAQAPLLVPGVGLALGISAVYGTRWSVLGRPWPLVRRLFRIGPPAELESEFPPRFAQLLGTLGLALATILLAAGLAGAGWLVTGAVASLQVVLAATGYCLGCRLYGLRWYAPRLFARLIAASSQDAAGRSA